MKLSGHLAEIVKLNWKPFSDADFDCFAGVETEKPMIAETSDGVYIIDGDVLQFFPIDPEKDFSVWKLDYIY